MPRSAPPSAPASAPDDAPEASWEGASPDAPRSMLAEVVERMIAAVVDDEGGRRLRLALLTIVQTAAGAAGRTLPPEIHALRTRVLRGDVPWSGDGPALVGDADPSTDREVLDAAADAVQAANSTGRPEDGGYDGLFAPLHDDALDALLRRSTIAVRTASLGATSACVVTPPLFGRYLALCSADASPDQRRVALRRALAHVRCAHVGELTPLPFPAPAAVARTADVFALADLVPFWQLHAWRRARLGWRATIHEATRAAAALAPDWDAARAADTARLRVMLYRERHL